MARLSARRIVASYRPPSSSDDYLVNLCKHLEFIKNSHPNSAFWVAGDVNLPDINWQDNCIEGHQYSLNTNNIFLDFLNINGLSQMVNSPTRGSNILDVFVTNRPSLIESCTVIDGISDHEVVLTKSLIQAESCTTARRHIYLWSKANFNYIRQSIQSLCEDFVSFFTVTTPITTLWNRFSDICNHCLKLIPSKWSTTKQNQPWITRHIKQLSRKKQRAYNRARLTNHASDWSTYSTSTLKDSLNGSAVQHLTNMYLTSLMAITMLLRSCGLSLKTESRIVLALVHSNIRAQLSLIHCLKQMF